MSLRFALLLALFATTAFVVPGVAAQTAPQTGLTLKDLPAAPLMSNGDTLVVPLSATLQMQNIVCSSATSAPVTVAATVSAPNLTGNATIGAKVLPGLLSFPVGAGAYGSNGAAPVGKPYMATLSFAVTVLTHNLTSRANASVEAKVTLGNVPNCQGASTIPPASSAGTFSVVYDATEFAPKPESPKMPAPPAVALMALGALVAFIRRGKA